MAAGSGRVDWVDVDDADAGNAWVELGLATAGVLDTDEITLTLMATVGMVCTAVSLPWTQWTLATAGHIWTVWIELLAAAGWMIWMLSTAIRKIWRAAQSKPSEDMEKLSQYGFK